MVNLWFPYQIVSDIATASRPQGVRGTGQIGWWWGLWVTSSLLGLSAAGIVSHDEVALDTLRLAASISTASTVLYLVAAVLIILTIRRINAWQTQPVPRCQGWRWVSECGYLTARGGRVGV